MQHFKIGLRTLKTAIAVAICMIISHLIARDSPVLSCLAAVYCMRTNTKSTMLFGKHRIFGTLTGGIVSVLAIILQNIFTRNIFTDTVIVFISIILIVLICNMRKHPESIITAASTMLIICFNTPATETITYAFLRMLDVLIGAGVAIAVDFTLPASKIKTDVQTNNTGKNN